MHTDVSLKFYSCYMLQFKICVFFIRAILLHAAHLISYSLITAMYLLLFYYYYHIHNHNNYINLQQERENSL